MVPPENPPPSLLKHLQKEDAPLDESGFLSLSNLLETFLQLLTPDGIQASTWELYKGAVFGRDSERVALDVVPWLPSVVERTVFSLVRLQGTTENPETEEEEGRIHHEYRHLYVGGRKVGPEQELLLKELSERWGGNGKEMIYYGTVDATPQLVRLVAAHCYHYGQAILDEEFIHRNGTVRTVRESILSAIRWVSHRISQSELSLLEFCRTNPRGLRWQAMRDGAIAYLHENGRLANARRPIASLEVQGLAYDALMYGAELFQEQLPEEAALWGEQARILRQETLNRFWMPEEGMFAMAIDRQEKQGEPRQVRTLSSVAAELLETRLFDSLAEEEKDRYISSIIRTMYSPDFLTEVGLRCRAQRYHNLVPYWDYQGSLVSWVVTSNIFAQGLRRQGFLELAQDLEERVVHGVLQAGAMLEYFYVDQDGTVHYRHSQEATTSGDRQTIVGPNVPENTQAWTVSALLHILLQREGNRSVFPPIQPSYWQRRTELEILEQLPSTPTEVSSTSTPVERQYYVDRQQGKSAEQSFLESLGYSE